MRQHITIIVLFVISAISLFWSACSHSKVDNFERVKSSMSKDEVLDILGSPNRTERIDGKEKWAYRYYTGDERNVEALKHVTFYEGRVISFGDDSAESQRLQEMRQSDDKKIENRSKRKSNPHKTSATNPTQEVYQPKPDLEDELAKVKQNHNAEFKELKGKHEPVDSTNLDE